MTERHGDLYPPDASNAAYWNHVHRTGYRSRGWTDRRGDVLLGRFRPARLDWTDMFWYGFSFDPEPAFEDIRPLFDEELRLLNEEWGINDLSQEHNAAYEKIDAFGFTLVDSEGWTITEFMLHVDSDNNAWFRY